MSATPTAARRRCTARGSPIPMSCRISCPKSSDCEPTAHGSASDLFSARDVTELRHRSNLVVHIDAAHRGLGTASCGPDTLPHYRVRPGRYVLAYRILLR
ncbi:MAG: hypothetical protein EBU67_10200 [Actinobacteria bacterium]|nr:hypothetical protein [Actinomycetota bacterium]